MERRARVEGSCSTGPVALWEGSWIARGTCGEKILVSPASAPGFCNDTPPSCAFGPWPMRWRLGGAIQKRKKNLPCHSASQPSILGPPMGFSPPSMEPCCLSSWTVAIRHGEKTWWARNPLGLRDGTAAKKNSEEASWKQGRRMWMDDACDGMALSPRIGPSAIGIQLWTLCDLSRNLPTYLPQVPVSYIPPFFV